jgi:hypothetical protein
LWLLWAGCSGIDNSNVGEQWSSSALPTEGLRTTMLSRRYASQHSKMMAGSSRSLVTLRDTIGQ